MNQSELPCRQYPDAWFTDDAASYAYPEGLTPIKALCFTCPARVACLELAQELERGLWIGLRHGIWGGLTPAERLAAVEMRPRVAVAA